MQQFLISLFFKLRFLIAGLFVLTCLFLLSLLISAITGQNAPAAGSGTDLIMNTGGPNQVSNGMAMALDSTSTAMNSVSATLSSSSKAVASGIGNSGSAVSRATSMVALGTYHGFAAAARGVGQGFTAIGRGIGHGFAATFLGIGQGFGYIGHSIGSGLAYSVRAQEDFGTSLATAAVAKPTIQTTPHQTVAEVKPAPPAIPKAKTAVSPTSTSVPAPAAPISIWPIHGEITTEFGVPEPPYQPIHTGIDISDGEPSGVTPVKAFRAGTVVEVVHGGGLGNHVVVDHGNGLTSVYGHMYSTAVSIGQKVDTTTTLGLEGSTGVATGPHVHFEIRINGQPVNPHLYLPAQP